METSRQMFQSARDLREAGDIDGAFQIYEAILVREPDHAPSLHALGVLLNHRGEFKRAAVVLERAVTLCPGDPAWHIDLGESYRNLRFFREAVGCCLTGLRLRPAYPEGWNTFGLALRDAGDREGALEQFLKALACREDFYPAHANAALILQELGRLGQAIPHFLRAAELAGVSS